MGHGALPQVIIWKVRQRVLLWEGQGFKQHGGAWGRGYSHKLLREAWKARGPAVPEGQIGVQAMGCVGQVELSQVRESNM